MRETAADLEELRAVLDRSAEKASPFPRRSFEMPRASRGSRRRGHGTYLRVEPDVIYTYAKEL